jgi:hypothetical protein
MNPVHKQFGTFFSIMVYFLQVPVGPVAKEEEWTTGK